MSKVLCICGRKTSGKSTICNFLHGYQLKAYGIIDDFDLTDKGKLVIKSKSEDGQEVNGMIDITRRDMEFAEWAAYNVWPFVKQYSFASALKELAVGLFDVPYEAIYGTNEEKEQKVPHLLWENMPGVVTSEIVKLGGKLHQYQDIGLVVVDKYGPMSGREFMQFLGTEIMRRMYPDIHAKNTVEQIKQEESQLSLIDDGRFDNEIDVIHKAGGKAIYIIRVESEDGHASENGFINTEFDATIDARGLSMKDMCEKTLEIINGWGWLGVKE